jgi:sulfur relay (sulfurtransferase) DsrF/TusC family protein
MADVKLAFIVQRPPYKTENTKLSATHALAYQTVEILLEDEETITPTVCYIGEGVLNCISNQKAMDHYGITSTEMHLKTCLVADLNVLVCKEDIERFGIPEDRIVDAEDIGAEKKVRIVSIEEIQKVIESANHLLFF